MFRYHSTAESNAVTRDQIIDFTPGTDKIDLSRIDATRQPGRRPGLQLDRLQRLYRLGGAVARRPAGRNWILEGDTNGDSVADLVIALTLQGPTPLGAGDFVL